MSIKLRANVSGFTAGLRTAQTDTTNLGRKMTETGAAADQMRRRLEAATKALPKIEIDADSSAAEVKFAQLRRDLEALASKKIGIDVDADVARAQLADIERELEQLQRTEVDVNVRADIGTALAELRAVDVELKRVDGRDARVQVDADVGGALASIAMVGAALTALPAVTTLAVGVTALGGAFAAAGLGAAGFAAVAVPSMGRVSEALKAQEAAAKAAGGATGGAGQSAAQAAQQAMQLEQAEKRLADAQKDERQAQEDLTRAREDGRRALEDMNFSLDRSILSQKDAALAVREAAERLAEVNADPEASSLERERAELSYQQALQRSEEQQVKTQRAIKDTTAANKAGVKGTQEYQRAQENVIAAQEKVAQAEQQLKVLRLQQKEAMASAGGAAGGLKDALADLSKEERAMVKDLEAFQKGYQSWQQSLQPDVFPAIRQGMDLVLLGLDKIGPGVSGAGKAFTTLGKDAEAALRGPFWTDFFNDVNTKIPGAVTSLGHTGMNVFTGLAGVVQAFLPYADDVTAALERGSEKFANWGTGLGDSSGFQRFLLMVREDGPVVVEALGNLATAAGHVVEAAAPFAGMSVAGLSLLSDVLAGMSPDQIQGVAIAVAAVYGAVKTGQIVSAGAEALGVLRERISGTGDAAGGAKTKLGQMAGLLAAGGPWGIAVGAGIGVLGMFATKHAEAEGKVREFTDAIRADSGALGENTRAKVANMLESEGLLKVAKDAGISLPMLTDAILGNSRAYAEVERQLKGVISTEQSKAQSDFSLVSSALKRRDAAQELMGALQGESANVREATEAHRRQQEAMNGATTQTGQLADAQGGLSGKTAEAAEAFARQLPHLMEMAGSNAKAKAEVLKLAEAYGISAEDAKKAAEGGKGLAEVLNKLESKEIRIFVKTEFQDDLSRAALRQATSARANGGIYGVGGRQYMADGGIRDVAGPVLMAWGGVRSVGAAPGAMIATGPKLISGRPGPDVVFGEAGPEAFIPLSSGRRARGLEVLTAAANIMGQTVMPAAAGSSVSSSSTTIGGSVTNVGGAVTSIGGARTMVGGSYGSRVSSPTTINSSQVSRPVSGGVSGGGWSSADVSQIAGQLATIVTRLDSMERRNPVNVQSMQVREQADISVISAQLAMRLSSRG
ncbi:hypothetical protein ACWDR1_29435 [Streptosporangium sandarakinum]